MRERIMSWSAQCPSCGTWRSTLVPEIESSELHASIDTGARVAGFRELRMQNNVRILDELSTLAPLAGADLLDVGSAHGWFLDEAKRRGMNALGLEPEDATTEQARERGLSVRSGYFPDALADGETFDVISFNDVLEHIPDVDATLGACARALRPGGVLSVNIPSAAGLVYRIATGLARIGVRGPYQRLWQHGLPSPHVHYFMPVALARVIERHGFRVARILPLSSIRRDGLWARVHTVSRPSPLSVLNFAALWIGAPIFNRPAQSDIVLVLAQRSGD